MANVRDLRGMRFGRLVVNTFARRAANFAAYWECTCDCGAVKTIRGTNLTTGATKSCGCLNAERRVERATKHGGNGSASYKSWRHMRDRCRNPKNAHYGYYGGRGITICPSWDDYAVFRADMGEPPEGCTLDRINPDGNYEPSNCRWASKETQGRNQRARKNASGHTGVYGTPSGKWVSQIRIGGGKRVCGPARSSIEEAIEDRKEMVRLYWGSADGS